jgi:hypothetical protein
MIGFAENYNFEIQNKVQSMHWHIYQVKILVQICWMRNPNLDPQNEDSKTIMRYLLMY